MIFIVMMTVMVMIDYMPIRMSEMMSFIKIITTKGMMFAAIFRNMITYLYIHKGNQ